MSTEERFCAETATVDECIDWLRTQRPLLRLTIHVPPGGASAVWLDGRPHYGNTLQRAFAATCEAIR